MKKTLMRGGLFFASLLFCMSAFSLTLGEAKQQGLVGERPDGLLGLVDDSSAKAKALVKVINGKRKAAYADIARRNGTKVSVVQNLAGEKAIKKTPAGQFVLVDGAWQRVK